MSDLAERVARGAALLDERRPGWAQEIAVDRLVMDSCFSCILGQLYGSFYRAEVALTLDWFDPLLLGFDITRDVASSPDGPRVFAELDALWQAAISRRLSPREAPRA